MANSVVTNSQGITVVTLDTTAVVAIGNADSTRVSKYRIHAKMGGGSPGSAIPKIRLTGSGLTGSDLISPVYYKDSDTAAITAGTAITTNDMYEVVCDRCDLFFDYTSGASGMVLYCDQVLG